MPISYDWNRFCKSPLKLYLTAYDIERLVMLGTNCRLYGNKYGCDIYGKINKDTNIAGLSDRSEVCILSNSDLPGLDGYRINMHDFSALNEYSAYNDFTRFWRKAEPGHCLLNVFTRASGRILADGAPYLDYWMFTNYDLNSYINETKILASKGVTLLGGIVYVCPDNRIGLAITHLDTARNAFCHVENIRIYDSGKNPSVSVLEPDSDGHQYIGCVKL